MSSLLVFAAFAIYSMHVYLGDDALSSAQARELATALIEAADTVDRWSVSTEELLLELRRRIIAPPHRRHNTWDDWDDGLDTHGDWTEQG
jgi:hypothetical protein